jgi:hypothetical protein
MKIETILTPAELPALAQRDLRATACVVFDVLRAAISFPLRPDENVSWFYREERIFSAGRNTAALPPVVL